GTPSGLHVAGSHSPFTIAGAVSLPSGFQQNTDLDGDGDFFQPLLGFKRYIPNWIKHLNADLLDGYHATLNVVPYGIAVRTPTGHLRVPLDTSEDDHAASKRYVDNARGGIRVRTAVALKTIA